MLEKITFAGLQMALPEGWCDITDDQPGSAPTLAREDGVGAIQFTTAWYKAGARPDFSEPVLRRLLAKLSEGGRGPPGNVREWREAYSYLAGDFSWDGWFMRAWYVSNGTDLAFVTYTVEAPLGSVATAELRDADALVESLSFEP